MDNTRDVKNIVSLGKLTRQVFRKEKLYTATWEWGLLPIPGVTVTEIKGVVENGLFGEGSTTYGITNGRINSTCC